MIKLIVATGPGGLIGRGEAMAWNIPAELQLFKRLTTGHSLLLGGTTFRHLPRPLRNRTLYVWTRTALPLTPAVHALTTPAAVEALLVWFATRSETLWIAGGKTVYERYYHWADELVVSEVAGPASGDVYLHWDLSSYERELMAQAAEFKTYRYFRAAPLAIDNRKRA